MTLHLRGASGNNLKGVDLAIPSGLLTCVTGVSGSGKSTLINDTLFSLAANEINGSSHPIAPYKEIDGLDLFDKVVDIDRRRSAAPAFEPGHHTGLFTPARTVRTGARSVRVAIRRAVSASTCAVAAAKPARATA